MVTNHRAVVAAAATAGALILLAVLLIAVVPDSSGVQYLGDVNAPPAGASAAERAGASTDQRKLHRAPYTRPISPSLEVELQIPRQHIAKLPGPDPLVLPPNTVAAVSVTTDSRRLAQLYFAAINKVRTDRGMRSLRWDEDLAARAEGYATTRLWWWEMDEFGQIWRPYDDEMRQYFGIEHPDYPQIGTSSGLASTRVLEGPPDLEVVLGDILDDETNRPVYGAALDPRASVAGIAVVMGLNTTPNVPIGWLTILYQ